VFAWEHSRCAKNGMDVSPVVWVVRCQRLSVPHDAGHNDKGVNALLTS
jgi:hypothetical protein